MSTTATSPAAATWSAGASTTSQYRSRKASMALSRTDWSLASRSTATSSDPSSHGAVQIASGQTSIFTRMSHSSPGVKLSVTSCGSPMSCAWPTTSTSSVVMAEWTSVSVSFSIAMDLTVSLPTVLTTICAGIFFQSFLRQPGISRVCASSDAAVLYAALVSDAGTFTVKETEDVSLLSSTSVAVAFGHTVRTGRRAGVASSAEDVAAESRTAALLRRPIVAPLATDSCLINKSGAPASAQGHRLWASSIE
mmetsp:Transcript_9888/g.30525  ORF Transcript_9888/g.30525 Transcript_9888/m.30525 type:complete len:251 (-) Transcript_9888:26-778(-)